MAAPVADTIEDFMVLLGESLKCQSNHSSPDNRICSTEVTHRIGVRCLNSTFLVCERHAKWAARRLMLRTPKRRTCRICKRPIQDCWTGPHLV